MLRMNKNNQKGLASIFISMIMMIVITLLVLGFVQFANKEASQVLTRQLSTAAFYVAESGVNEVKSIYQQDGSSIPSKGQCLNRPSYAYIQTLGNTSNISIPCLLVSSITKHLRTNLALGSSWITPINGTSNINYLTIGWQNPNIIVGSTGFNYCFGNSDTKPTYNLGPNIGTNNQGQVVYPGCDAGIIKVDLVPANNIGTEYTYYFYPQPVGQYNQTSSPKLSNVVSYGQYTEGIPLLGSCPGPNNLSSEYCNVTIDLGALNQATYYLRIKTFYLPANIEISAESSNPINSRYSNISFQGDQIVVDSTGKVSNVLQRIRVNLAPNYNGNNESGIVPNSALNITQGICKQFYYDGTNTYNGTNLIGVYGCKNF